MVNHFYRVKNSEILSPLSQSTVVVMTEHAHTHELQTPQCEGTGACIALQKQLKEAEYHGDK